MFKEKNVKLVFYLLPFCYMEVNPLKVVVFSTSNKEITPWHTCEPKLPYYFVIVIVTPF